jgi:hypothetical protein
MQDELTRAQHYRSLASQIRDAAERECDEKRRGELLELAGQYEHLAGKLVGKHVSRAGSWAANHVSKTTQHS